MYALNSRKTGSFVGDVVTISAGTAVAQLIGVITTPLLTRVFGVEAFGLLGLFISMIHIGEVISCLRYESSIMLPASDEEAANQLALSLTVAVIISSILFLVLWIGKYWLADLLKSPDLAPYIPWVSFTTLISGFFVALNSWNTRTKHFHRLATAKVLSIGGTSLSQLLIGLAGFTRGGHLIAGNIFGLSLSTLFLIIKIWIDHSLFFLRHISVTKMIAGMKRYRKFPLVSSWSSLLNTTSLQLPSLLLAAFFSPTVVGFYMLGHRVLRMPLSLIGNSISQVFYQRASEARLSGNLSSLVFNIISRLIAIGMFPILLLAIAGREIFVFIFGGNWGEAGIYMQILSIWTLFVFIGNPISTLTNVLEKQEASLIFNIILISSRVASLILGGLLGNVYLALVLFSASGVIAWAIYSLWLLQKSGVSPMSFLKLIGKYILISAPFLVVIIVYKSYFVSNPFIIVLLCGVAMLIYYGIVIYQDRTIQQFLFTYVKKFGLVKS